MGKIQVRRSVAGAPAPRPGRGEEVRVPVLLGLLGGVGKGLWGMGSLVLLSAACTVNPATGGRQLVLMTEAQEIQLGRDADADIAAEMGLYPDGALQEYVGELGRRLAQASERPHLPWTFRVLDSPLINAFALPGGYIYVTREILAYLESEAELAGVLGHEIGHVTARHSMSRISRAQLAQLGLGVGVILAPELRPYVGLVSTSLELLFLKFSRDDEREADALGVRYMARLGYDPSRLAGVMVMLSRVTSEEAGPRGPEWLATHPNPENRERLILELAARTLSAQNPPLVERDRFISRLDGLVFGENPREGFFVGHTFHHPDLAFSLDFPEGWRTANSRRAVQALSPQQDAVLLVTVAGEASARAAVAAFLSKEGMAGGPLTEGVVNGMPSARAPFRATTSERSLEGEILAVEHRGVRLLLVGYAASSAWAGRRGEVKAAQESLRPLTEARHLQVAPSRLRILAVPRREPLSALLAREGFDGKMDAIRTLNRLEGDPLLPAGFLLKIPIGGWR